MTYIVRSGDTLSGIAQEHNTTVAALVAANGIRDKNLIYIGQIIKIPDSETSDALPAEVKNALDACLAAIEKLPEFQRLERLLNG